MLLILVITVTSLAQSQSRLSSERILELANIDRQKQGLNQLLLDPELNLAALAKAEDMVNQDYFSHVSPLGIKPWYWFKALGYNYAYAGENLALGYTDSQELEKSWMSSVTHRANILSPLYSDVGIAVVKKNNTTLVVQFFGSKQSKLSLRQ